MGSRNNQLPAPVEPALPQWEGDTYDENLPPLNQLPGEDTRFEQDLYGDQVPQEVADDVANAAPPADAEIPQTGMGFDFNSLNVQTREDFDRLPLEQQELLKAMKRGVQFTPAGAADFVLKQQAARIQQEQRMAEKQGGSDQARAEMIQQANIDKVRAAYDANLKVQQTLDRLQGIKRKEDGSVVEDGGRWKPYVGFDSSLNNWAPAGTDRRQFGIDLQTLKDQLGLAARGSLKGQGPVSDFESKMLLNAAASGLDPSGTEESFGSTVKQIREYNDQQMNLNKGLLQRFESGTNSSPAAQPAAASAPSADTRPRKSLMGTTYAVNSDGTLEKVAK